VVNVDAMTSVPLCSSGSSMIGFAVARRPSRWSFPYDP
jgi:hypothetical protein